MDHLDSMEKGKVEPLLLKGSSSKKYSIRAPLSPLGSPAIKEPPVLQRLSKRRASAIILGINYLEGTAFSGVSTNLVVYLQTVLHQSNTWNAANFSVWSGTSYFTPLIGAIIADSYLGNYRTIFISAVMYLLGLAMITLTALNPSLHSPPCEGDVCSSASWSQYLTIFSGLYLVAVGSGGVKSALLPFGAEQFNDERPEEKETKCSFFNKFYVCLTLGSLTSGIIIVWIQTNVSWALGFGIATICMAVALTIFVLGTPAYRIKTPSGSPFKSILQVFIATLRKIRMDLPPDSSYLYELTDKEADSSDRPKLEHTEGFRLLDKAAIVLDTELSGSASTSSSWSLCTVTQVEEVKILLRLLPIWATGIIFNAAYSQMYTTFIQQGTAMDHSIGSFSFPPASLSSFHVFCAVAWVFTFNKFLVPLIRKKSGCGLSPLQRMGVGRFMIILTMAAAACVENKRLASARAGETISIAWQLPQYFVLAGAEIFNNISQLEFFYGQAPNTMKSMCTALALLTISMGSYMSSMIITIVGAVTTAGGEPGWISDDLNEGHLDYYFLGFSALCTLNFATYLAFASKYKHKKVLAEI